MASIEKRTRADGTVSWRVHWRVDGTSDGAWDSETCDDLTTARRFRGLVEAAGERRPAGYPKGCRVRRITADLQSQSGPAAPPGLSFRLSAVSGRTFGQVTLPDGIDPVSVPTGDFTALPGTARA